MSLFDTKMTALADAIKAKNANAAAKLSIDGMITAVNEIEQGGSGNADIQFGYINDAGQFQSLDLSGDTPVDSGDPVTVDAVTFNTGKESPEYGGDDENSGGEGGSNTGGDSGSMELYRCASVEQSKVGVGFFVAHSKVTATDPEGYVENLYLSDIEYVEYNKGATGSSRLWIDKNDIQYINDDWPELDVLGWDGNRWIMCIIYSITDTPSETNGVANSNCTNPNATMAEIASATWDWSPMGGDSFADKVTVLEEWGAITGWSGYKVTVGVSPVTKIKVTGAYDGVYALADASATGKDREFHLVGDTSEEPHQIMYYGTYWGLFDYSMAMVMLESDCTNPDATVQEICNATWTHIMDSSAELSFEPVGSAGEQWIDEGELITGLACDGFVPRIGKVYSIDTKLQTSLFSDPAGAGFYQCLEGASVPSKFMLSNAGNTAANGEYIRKDNSFNGYNSGALGIWYKAGTSSSSSDHWALLIYPNKNSYSVILSKGYIDNDKFQLQYHPYRIDKNFKTFDEALELMKDTSKWNTFTGSHGGVAPAPTVSYTPASGTWKGYKLSQNSDGTWSKAATETDGLKVGWEEPQIGTIYNEDATVTISGAMGLE